MQTKNLSYWVKSVKQNEFSKLEKDIDIDVAIIGGGITGLTTALLLAEQGVKATVFEANQLGHGATGYTTAKVTCQHGLIYSQLIESIDEDTARIYADVNKQALENISRVIHEYSIDCDLKTTSANVYAGKKESVEKLQREFVAAKALGFDVAFDNDVSLPFKAYANLRFENQLMFHPIKYINGITKAIRDKAVQIHEHTRITNIEKKDYYELTTSEGHKINAEKVIISTKYPILNKKKLMFTKLFVQRSYVVAAVMPNFRINGYYINAEDKVRSIRQYNQAEERLVLIAGANHEAGDCENAQQSYLKLIKFANELDDDTQIKYKWSTQDCMTVDKMPYIGQVSDDMKGVYAATGFNKWGMTQSMVAAMVLSGAIADTSKKWHNIFKLDRKINKDAAKEIVKKGANVAGDYIRTILPVKSSNLADIGTEVGSIVSNTAKDIIKIGDDSTGNYSKAVLPLDSSYLDKIETGVGRIIKVDGDVVGAYRDETGDVFTIIPKCPHLGCRLEFNQAERTWDCPCHGSRFTYKGDIIESPAVSKLDIKN